MSLPHFLVDVLAIYVSPQFGMNPEPVQGSVTANIGWYVVSILHHQPSCNINITWPVESTLWVVH